MRLQRGGGQTFGPLFFGNPGDVSGSCSQRFGKSPEGSRQGSKRISFLFFKKSSGCSLGNWEARGCPRRGGEA